MNARVYVRRRTAGPVTVAAMDDLRAGDVVIPSEELTWRFSTSGGPGGQHANRSATRVELRFDAAASSALTEEQVERLARHLGSTVVLVVAGETRSQWRNRQTARHRLAQIVAEALRPDPEPRRKTKRPRSADRRRLDDKKARGRTKELRKKPPDDD
jgi:ribosome-associated protein